MVTEIDLLEESFQVPYIFKVFSQHACWLKLFFINNNKIKKLQNNEKEKPI